MKLQLTAIFFLLALLSGCIPQVDDANFKFLLLTWNSEDTSTSITVNYRLNEDFEQSTVLYDTVSRAGDPASYRYRAVGQTHRIFKINDNTIHRVPLTGLTPGTTYWFIAGDAKGGYSKERKFKTIPGDGAPISFVSGGDMGSGSSAKNMLAQSASYAPDFATVGGDIAYANGLPKNYHRWEKWLNYYSEHMVTPDGYTIPVVAAIGNHEVNLYLPTQDPIKKAPYFTALFAQTENKKTYFKRKFGANLMFYILDTGHVFRWGGRQSKWLKSNLERDHNIKHLFALYHVPLYPSHRHYKGIQNVIGRKRWLPLFDKYRLDTAFENHDHTQKRTHILKNGKISNDGSGTLYLGDGCWGKSTREAKAKRWYLKNANASKHFWYVKVNPEAVIYQAINQNDEVFDQIIR